MKMDRNKKFSIFCLKIKEKIGTVPILFVLISHNAQAQSQSPQGNAAAPSAPIATVPRPKLPQDPYLAALENITSPYPQVRRQAVEFLAQSRNPAGIPTLIKALSDSDPSVRSASVHALGLLRVKSAAAKISQLLAKDPSAQVRQNAAVSLAYFADPASVPALISAISDPSESVRFSAMRTLGALRAQAAAPALIKALKSPSGNIRQTAAAALGQIQASSAVPALASLTLDSDPTVRQAAVSALGSIGGAEAIKSLLRALKDKDFSVAIEAARSLARLGNSKGAFVALKGLKDKNVFTRQKSIVILGLIGGHKDLLTLQKLFKQEKDLATQSVISFAEQQIKARLGMKPSKSLRPLTIDHAKKTPLH